MSNHVGDSFIFLWPFQTVRILHSGCLDSKKIFLLLICFEFLWLLSFFMKMLSNFSPWLPNLPEKKVQNLFELLKCLGYITFQGLWNQVSFPLIDSLPLFHLTGMLTYFFFFKGNCWSELMILWFVLFLFYYKTMFFKSLQFHKVFGKQILQTEYDVMNNNRILKLSFSEKTTKNSHNNLPQGFDICSVNVKTMRKILQFFLTFSEKLNFDSKNLKNSIWNF